MSACRHWIFKNTHIKNNEGRRIYQCHNCGRKILLQWRFVHTIFVIVIFNAMSSLISSYLKQSVEYSIITGAIMSIQPRFCGSILSYIIRFTVEVLMPFGLASILVLPFIQRVVEQEVNTDTHCSETKVHEPK
jgi:phosphotransferase system  glucose/maltose/N-acetylglucosamine-specific IIC component